MYFLFVSCVLNILCISKIYNIAYMCMLYPCMYFFWRASCPHGDNQKCLQTGPNVPKGTKSVSVENCCSRQTVCPPEDHWRPPSPEGHLVRVLASQAWEGFPCLGRTSQGPTCWGSHSPLAPHFPRVVWGKWFKCRVSHEGSQPDPSLNPTSDSCRPVGLGQVT